MTSWGDEFSYDDDEGYSPESKVECKLCGVGGLHWAQDGGRWVLMANAYMVHKCDAKRLEKQLKQELSSPDKTD